MRQVAWLQLPFDTGLSGGRNRAIERCTAPYVVLLDDDFVFTAETRIERLTAILDDDPSISIVGGLIRFDGLRAGNWAARLIEQQCEGKRLIIPRKPDEVGEPWRLAGGVRYRECDIIFNFFAARREVFDTVPYDEQFKIGGEHLDFFLRAKAQGLKVVYTPECIVGHIGDSPPGYEAFRMRKGWLDTLLTKHNLLRPLGFHWYPEQGISDFDIHKALRSDREKDMSPIVLLTEGHTGSSLVAKMLMELGFNCPGSCDDYGEPVEIRQLNEKLRRKGAWEGKDRLEAASLLRHTPLPWVIKDPRLCEVMEHWIPLFEAYSPLLLRLARNPRAVEASWKERGESLELLRKRITLCDEVYRSWPWQRCTLTLESILSAANLVGRYEHPDRQGQAGYGPTG